MNGNRPKNYLLEVTEDGKSWMSTYFLPSEFSRRRLAEMVCPTCDGGSISPDLPQVAEYLDRVSDEIAVANRTWSSLISVRLDTPCLGPEDFKLYGQKIREIVGLPDSMIISSQARIEPLKLRWRTRTVPNIVISTMDATVVVVKAEIAQAISQTHPDGILWVPVQYHPKSQFKEPMMEMVVTGTADIQFSDDDYVESIANHFGEPEMVRDFLRCPTCHQFPYKAPYMLSAPITPTADAFRLADFPGLYVTEALKSTLERFQQGVLFFEELPIKEWSG